MRYAAVLAALFGCSSGNFDVAAPADSGSGASDTDTVTDTVAVDSGPLADDGPSDTAKPDTAAPCTELAPNPPTVFVDKRTTRAAKGTSECPFKSIKDALAFVSALPSGSGKHTVRVVGGDAGAPLVYDEPMLVIKPLTELRGDGADRVVVTGGSVCGTEGSVCMVIMEGNTALEGVTIDAKGASKAPLAIIGAEWFQYVSVKSTVLRGAGEKTPAMYVDGAGTIDIGPELKVIDNANTGITVKSTGSLKLNGLNQISRNGGGIYMLGGQLDISGPTQVSANKSFGIAMAASDKRHNFDGVTVADNASYGIYIDGGSLKMRRSKVVRNDIGLMYRYGIGNDLDLGTVLSPGENFFGGKLETNKRAAICLPVYRSATTNARGNGFNVCPPSPLAIGEGEKVCDTIPMGYSDIYYGVGISPGSNPPLDLAGCTSK